MSALSDLKLTWKPEDFGDADDAALTARLQAYLDDGNARAEAREIEEDYARDERVLTFARARALEDHITYFRRNPDKFRAEGDVSVEFDVEGRLKSLVEDRDRAFRESGLSSRVLRF